MEVWLSLALLVGLEVGVKGKVWVGVRDEVLLPVPHPVPVGKRWVVGVALGMGLCVPPPPPPNGGERDGVGEELGESVGEDDPPPSHLPPPPLDSDPEGVIVGEWVGVEVPLTPLRVWEGEAEAVGQWVGERVGEKVREVFDEKVGEGVPVLLRVEVGRELGVTEGEAVVEGVKVGLVEAEGEGEEVKVRVREEVAVDVVQAVRE